MYANGLSLAPATNQVFNECWFNLRWYFFPWTPYFNTSWLKKKISSLAFITVVWWRMINPSAFLPGTCSFPAGSTLTYPEFLPSGCSSFPIHPVGSCAIAASGNLYPSFLLMRTQGWEFSVGLVRRKWKTGNAFFFFLPPTSSFTEILVAYTAVIV